MHVATTKPWLFSKPANFYKYLSNSPVCDLTEHKVFEKKLKITSWKDNVEPQQALLSAVEIQKYKQFVKDI